MIAESEKEKCLRSEAGSSGRGALTPVRFLENPPGAPEGIRDEVRPIAGLLNVRRSYSEWVADQRCTHATRQPACELQHVRLTGVARRRENGRKGDRQKGTREQTVLVKLLV
jgi:hypothetical protein